MEFKEGGGLEAAVQRRHYVNYYRHQYNILISCVQVPLKGQCHKIFNFRLFYELSSPKPVKITFGSFQIYLRIHRDIPKSRCTTGINGTGSKFANCIKRYWQHIFSRCQLKWWLICHERHRWQIFPPVPKIY